jgi:2-polyprenyl-6-methoxyphenol hydroxylase-like FAD-dependent oxidoreductase
MPGRQVVIVGAGPAGLTLAYLLARRGVGVTVLEAHHDFARVFRGEGLQRSGIDAFRQMGLGEQFDRVPHVEVSTVEIYSNGRLVVRADAAEHLRNHRAAVASATLLSVVCGNLAEWTIPGLLLIGDAAHPMSPVGGQGINVALRDALVAANHLVPVLTAEGDATAIDAAARRVREERSPEIAVAQRMQQGQARMLFAPDGFRTRLLSRLLPWLVRTGLLQWLHRKQYRLMSDGVVPVRLVA